MPNAIHSSLHNIETFDEKHLERRDTSASKIIFRALHYIKAYRDVVLTFSFLVRDVPASTSACLSIDLTCEPHCYCQARAMNLAESG